jgi:hypothetical protein
MVHEWQAGRQRWEMGDRRTEQQENERGNGARNVKVEK